MYTGVHSNVSQESYFFELFDLRIPLDVPLAYVSLWIPLF